MKFIYIFMLLFVFTIFNCTVNENTGLIKIENQTAREIRNLRVGETLITRRVAAGKDYYYWYFNTMAGKVSAENMDVFTGFDKEWEFETGYWIHIIAEYLETQDGVDSYLVIAEEKQGP